MQRKRNSPYDGLQKDIKHIKTPSIEVWKNQYPEKNYVVKVETDEFTCICPKTGLPDFAKIEVEYSPNKYCIELKSFKMYLLFYRNIGIFHEHVINRILDDFVKSSKPKWAKVTGVFNARGGIVTTVNAEYKNE